METPTTSTTTATTADVAEIKAGLARDTPVASTMNFVVWIDEPSVRDWVLERAAKIAEKHPARTIVFDADPDRASGAAVSSNARAGDEAQTVQGHRVDIPLHPDEHGRACSMLAGLRQPDLPTVLWWAGDRITGEPAFDALIDCGADTVVLDSSGIVATDSLIRDLQGFRARHPDAVLRDLAWLRLRPWQDMIAQFFDDPALVEELFAVRRIRIESGSDAEALYLASWLASRLGWRPTGRGEFTDRSGGPVTFEHRRSGDLRRVHEVVLETDGSTYRGRVRDDDAKIVEVWSDGAHAREPRMIPLRAIDNASLIERAILESSAADPVFETALDAVRTLLG